MQKKSLRLLSDFDHVYNSEDPYFSLCGAVAHGYVHVVKFLLECGVDPNKRSEKNCRMRSPLHVIAREDIEPQYEKILRLLLRYGARPNIKDNFGKTPLKILKSRLIDDNRFLTALEYGVFEDKKKLAKGENSYCDPYGLKKVSIKRIKRMIKLMQEA